MEEQAKLLADLASSVPSMNAKIDEMHPAVLDLHSWKPHSEQSVENLRAEVGDLRSRVVDISRSVATSPTTHGPPPLLHLGGKLAAADAPSPTLTAAELAGALAGIRRDDAGDDGHGQFGHRDASNHRSHLPVDSPSSGGAPAKGTYLTPGPGYDSSEFQRRENSSSRLPPPPRVEFPLFDGENPRAWRLKCEAYFKACATHPDSWVSCAAMYFIDDALACASVHCTSPLSRLEGFRR